MGGGGCAPSRPSERGGRSVTGRQSGSRRGSRRLAFRVFFFALKKKSPPASGPSPVRPTDFPLQRPRRLREAPPARPGEPGVASRGAWAAGGAWGLGAGRGAAAASPSRARARWAPGLAGPSAAEEPGGAAANRRSGPASPPGPVRSSTAFWGLSPPSHFRLRCRRTGLRARETLLAFCCSLGVLLRSVFMDGRF